MTLGNIARALDTYYIGKVNVEPTTQVIWTATFFGLFTVLIMTSFVIYSFRYLEKLQERQFLIFL